MKSILIITICLIAGTTFGQNRPHYSLYMLRQNIINPAAIGTQDAFSAATVGNTQINGFAGNPRTLGADLIIPIGQSGFVTGVNVGVDKIGVNSRTSGGLTLGYRLKLATDHYLTFGVNGMGVQQTSAYSELVVDDATDPIYLSKNFSSIGYDIAFGLHYFTNNFYFGVGTMNITEFVSENPNDLAMTSRVSMGNAHVIAHAGYQHSLGTDWKIMPSVLYKGIAGSPDQFDLNLQFNYKDVFGFGPLFRTANSFAFQVNGTIAESFTCAYSYNMGIGFKSHTNFTGHELMLIYKAKSTKKRLPVSIPRF